jgi:hypothetical protein
MESNCPYKSIMNKFSLFGGNKVNESLSTLDTEKGPELELSQMSKCPFSEQNQNIENKSIKQEKKIENDADSDEEEGSKGGCPVMNKGIVINLINK